MHKVDVFVDFDGTITDRDTFDVLVRHFAGDAAWHATERGLHDGSVALRDVLQLQASHVRAGFSEVAALLERFVRVDETFAAFVARCRTLGMAVTVVSSGVEPLIRLRLAALGLGDLRIVANQVDADHAGWHIRFRDHVPNGTDKAALVHEAREAGATSIFIGDGLSDYAAALEADYRFARRGRALERYLRDRGLHFEAFSSFADITCRLPLARSCLAGT